MAWFAAPWSLLLLWPGARVAGTSAPRVRAWIRFCALGALAAVAMVALRDTRADRYAFAAYFLAGAGGTSIAVERWAAAARWAERADGWWPWGPALFWLALAMTRLIW